MKIIKLLEGDQVPEGAKFLHSQKEKVKTGEKQHFEYGWLGLSKYLVTTTSYLELTYFYYETKDEKTT